MILFHLVVLIWQFIFCLNYQPQNITNKIFEIFYLRSTGRNSFFFLLMCFSHVGGTPLAVSLLFSLTFYLIFEGGKRKWCNVNHISASFYLSGVICLQEESILHFSLPCFSEPGLCAAKTLTKAQALDILSPSSFMRRKSVYGSCQSCKTSFIWL